MPQSTYPFDAKQNNDSELFFDHFTFEELQDPQDPNAEEAAQSHDAQESEEDVDFQQEMDDDPISQNARECEQVSQDQLSPPPPLPLQQSRLMLLRATLVGIAEKINKALELVEAGLPSEIEEKVSVDIGDITGSLTLSEKSAHSHPSVVLREGAAGADRVLEGVFDGQNMAGSDGNRYAIPQNYASKSKLVEGDALKLTIAKNGSFIYKQIGPVERTRVVGFLNCDRSNNMYYVRKDNKRWSVLSASVTYFKGRESDETVIIVPRDRSSFWGAVENIIKKKV